MKVYHKHIAHKLPINNINLKYLSENNNHKVQKKKHTYAVVIIAHKRVKRINMVKF